ERSNTAVRSAGSPWSPAGVHRTENIFGLIGGQGLVDAFVGHGVFDACIEARYRERERRLREIGQRLTRERDGDRRIPADVALERVVRIGVNPVDRLRVDLVETRCDVALVGQELL